MLTQIYTWQQEPLLRLISKQPPPALMKLGLQLIFFALTLPVLGQSPQAEVVSVEKIWDKAKHNGLINQVVATNKILLIITKTKAFLSPITPAGISLLAVRGFNLSKRLSIQRLKPIAALRAKTIHSNIKPKSLG